MGGAERRLADVARRQHGLVTRPQALASGLSTSAWARRLRGGGLESLHPGVARLDSAPRTDEQCILAAVLAVQVRGCTAMASHTAAARLWGVPLRRWRPEVVVAERSRSPRLRGVVVHRPTDTLDLFAAHRSGIPVTNPLRLLVDLGAVATEAEVETALDVLLVARTVTLAGVGAALARHSGPGRAGVGVLRAVLDRWALDEAPDSTFEAAVSRLLDRHRLPRPCFHLVIAGHEVDFAFPTERVAVEVDGWATHGRREAFEQDRARDLAIAAHGWIVVRLTWRALTRRPDAAIDQLQAVLASRRRHAS